MAKYLLWLSVEFPDCHAARKEDFEAAIKLYGKLKFDVCDYGCSMATTLLGRLRVKSTMGRCVRPARGRHSSPTEQSSTELGGCLG
jgi:hypothetical protein